MASWLKRLIILVCLVLASAYFVAKNHTPVALTLWPGQDIETLAGVALLVAFIVGMLTAALISAVFGLRAYLRERHLRRIEERREGFLASLARARGLRIVGKTTQAASELERLVTREPQWTLAKLELADTLLAADRPKEALKALDEVRSKEPENLEILYRAAQIYMALGNKTAAVDSLALVLYHQPTQQAASLARDLSEDLDRIDDALEYHARVRQLGSTPPDWAEVQARLEYRKLAEELVGAENEVALTQLRQFVKRYPGHVPALAALADKEARAGRVDSAAQLFLSAGQRSGDPRFWERASEVWLEVNLPDRAVAALKSAINDCSPERRVDAELQLCRLLLRLEMIEDAFTQLEALNGRLAAEQSTPTTTPATTQVRLSALVLTALTSNRLGNHAKASQLWQKLSDELTLALSPRAFISRQDLTPSPSVTPMVNQLAID